MLPNEMKMRLRLQQVKVSKLQAKALENLKQRCEDHLSKPAMPVRQLSSQ